MLFMNSTRIEMCSIRVSSLLEQEEDPSVEIPPQYTEERPAEYYQYVLNGIIIHTGNADAGHYYSFIKDRKTGDWHEFNDNIVKEFDPETVVTNIHSWSNSKYMIYFILKFSGRKATFPVCEIFISSRWISSVLQR